MEADTPRPHSSFTSMVVFSSCLLIGEHVLVPFLLHEHTLMAGQITLVLLAVLTLSHLLKSASAINTIQHRRQWTAPYSWSNILRGYPDRGGISRALSSTPLPLYRLDVIPTSHITIPTYPPPPYHAIERDRRINLTSRRDFFAS